MRKIKYAYIYLVATLTIVFTSCNNDQLTIGNTDISSKFSTSISTIPFTDEQTLEEIAKNPKNVSYNVARKLALVEMEMGMKQSMNWNGTKLSEKPVVIYDSKSNAKYYEFIVLNETGKGIGTVTTCAQKEADAIITHVLPYVRDYSLFISKGSNYKMINGGYPNRILLGVLGKSGSEPSVIIDPNTGESVTNILSDDAQSLINTLLNMSSDDLKNVYITNLDSAITSIKQKDQLNKEYAKNYWELMDTLQTKLSSMSDQDINIALNSNKASWYSTDSVILGQYNSTGMRNTYWSGWCGPSAIAWTYRGLYSSYNSVYLPLTGESGFSNPPYRTSDGCYNLGSPFDDDNDGTRNDLDPDWVNAQSKNADGGLTAFIAKNSGLYNFVWLTGQGPILPGGLSDALLGITQGKYIFGNSPIDLLYFDGSYPHCHIRHYNLPVICWTDGYSHYVVAFGSKFQYYNWQTIIKIFGINIVIAQGRSRSNTWLLVHDNGYEIKNHGYKPYWKNDTFTLDLFYGVYKQF